MHCCVIFTSFLLGSAEMTAFCVAWTAATVMGDAGTVAEEAANSGASGAA